MEKYEDQLLHLNDQRCHLFTYGNSTLCLVCKQTLLFSTGLNSTEELILNHLESSDHKECMRILFKMCMPDQACDFDDGKYLDIVTKSIFDISVLIGEESSYICQKDQHIVCLMCKSSISEIYSSFAQVKVEVTQHLDSAMHSNSVKEVCWFYRLNSRKDFLLFHKSILHCSICQETLKCRESELLQLAVGHLESHNHEVKCNIKQPHIATETVKEESPINYCEESYGLEVIDQKQELDDLCELKPPLFIDTGSVKEESLKNHYEGGPGLEVIGQKYQLDPFKLAGSIENNFIVKCEEQNQNVNKCRGIINVGTNDIGMKDVVCNHQCQDDHKFLDKCGKCIQKMFSSAWPETLKFFISVRKNKCFCTICEFDIYSEEGFISTMISYLDHVKSEKHREIMRKIEAGEEESKIKEREKIKLVANVISGENLNETINVNVVNESEMKDVFCHHQSKESNKLQGKCSRCIKRMFCAALPEVHKFYIQVLKKKCFCSICKFHLYSEKGFVPLMNSYLIHTMSKKHEMRESEIKERNKKWCDKKRCKRRSVSNVLSGEKSNETQKTSVINIGNCEIKDIDCHHHCLDKNKFLDKCRRCINTMFRKANPEVQKYYIAVRQKKCLCVLCRCNLSSDGNLNSLMISYLDHSKTEKHQKCESSIRAAQEKKKEKRRNRQTKKRRAIREKTRNQRARRQQTKRLKLDSILKS